MKFLDEQVNTYTANAIAEKLYSNVASEGHESFYLAENIEYRSDRSTISKYDGYTTSNGRDISKRTIIGCKTLYKWKDSLTYWVPLKYIKETYPVQVTE